MSELLKILKKPGGGKDQMLAKMAKMPTGYSHIGIANTEVGVTAVVASELLPPLVYDPLSKDWVALATKS